MATCGNSYSTDLEQRVKHETVASIKQLGKPDILLILMLLLLYIYIYRPLCCNYNTHFSSQEAEAVGPL